MAASADGRGIGDREGPVIEQARQSCGHRVEKESREIRLRAVVIGEAVLLVEPPGRKDPTRFPGDVGIRRQRHDGPA